MNIRLIPVLIGFLVFSTQASDIAIKETVLGQVYTNNEGMTLYYFDNDKPDLSNCYDDCAQAWPPFLVEDDTSQLPNLEIIKRRDGKLQWALDHHPLYLWNKDQKPGDITGAGFKNTWSLARVDKAPVKVYTTKSGKILTNKDNMSLYLFAKDTSGQSTCYDDCAANWPLLVAQKNDTRSGPFNIIERKDGTYQWTYQGSPLYTWGKDKKPGDITGDNIKNIWHLVSL